MPQRPLIEVCVSSVADAVAAERAGADRLELCSALEVGGLTPSAALVDEVLERVTVPVVAMIRPRMGGFHYAADEFRTALLDAKWALGGGVRGIVFGFLTCDRRIDEPRCQEIVALAGDRETVFHRAFDFVCDPLAAADDLVRLGVTRLLTSGQESTALAGAALIREIADRTRGQLTVMPGGGVRSDNVLEIIERTRCHEVHVGASRAERDSSLSGKASLELVSRPFLTDGALRKIDSAEIGELARRLKRDELGS
ncbi:MAG: copper homeostasis protein CutC [Pirellulales bacterium]